MMVFAHYPIIAAGLSLQCPDVTTTFAYSEIKRLKDSKAMSFRQIALEAPFSGRVPFGTLRDIYNGKRVPRKYRSIFFPRKPAVKHICGNCQAWDNNVLQPSEFSGKEWGICHPANHPTIDPREYVESSQLLPTFDFGCRFWRRKEGL